MCSRNLKPEGLNCLQNERCPYTNRGSRWHWRSRDFLLIFRAGSPEKYFAKIATPPALKSQPTVYHKRVIVLGKASVSICLGVTNILQTGS